MGKHKHGDEHPNPGKVGHDHQAAVHAGQDQATAERLAEAASLEGTEHRTGHTDREGFPVHAGHAHVAGTDGPTDEDPDTDNAEADTKGHQD